MISKLFSGIEKLDAGLDASWKRNEVIANNIANVNTPGFKRSYVEFEDYYKSAMSDDSFALKKTREGHMDFGGPSPGSARVVQDNSTTMRMDDNNVDIDSEMSDLAVNVIYYNALSQKVAGEISLLKTAIKEGG